jgi:hypothetical protein
MGVLIVLLITNNLCICNVIKINYAHMHHVALTERVVKGKHLS